MRILINIFLIIFIYSCIGFSADFEFSLGGSAGYTMEFSYVSAPEVISGASRMGGARRDSGFSASGFLDIGCNFELPNSKGALNSVSLLFETGYYYYMRVRSKYDYKNVYDKVAKYKERFFYHNLILGILPKLNFDNGISFGIGAGVFLPLYSSVNLTENENTTGLGVYSAVSEFKFAEISDMYKVPVMPYIKLNLEKSFYLSESWAFKFGGNIMYNFGMEFDIDKLSKSNKYTYDKYNFSSLSIELFLAVGFGRPK